MKECVGHFGHIELALPVFHFGFFKQTLQILRKVCKTCARVLLPEDELPKFTKFFYGKQLEVRANKRAQDAARVRGSGDSDDHGISRAWARACEPLGYSVRN